MIKGLSGTYGFAEAVPVWENGREREKNYSLVFRAVVKGKEKIELNIAAHSRYQIFIDGAFFAAGPARGAHGFYRVSKYEIEKELSESESIISIIAAGYNVNSYYLTDEPSFLCAEILRDGKVIFATGRKDAYAVAYTQRVRKVQRYSFQRPFVESYICSARYDAFMTDAESEFKTVELSKTGHKNFIARNTPYCEYKNIGAKHITAAGIVTPAEKKRKFTNRSLKGIDEKLKGFKDNELESCSVNEVYSYDAKILDACVRKADGVRLDAGGFCVYDMGKIYTGFIKLSLSCEQDAVIYAVFNETLPENGVPDAGRDGCSNVVKWTAAGGRSYDFVSFEPYAFRYIQIISISSPAFINGVSIYEEAYPESGITGLKIMPDAAAQKIYDAAALTFRANATDIFTDCPSRERAGWLCDSFFTARTERELTGKSLVEHDFLENFLLPEKFEFLPCGMLPMCYPADNNDGVYIHNWALWYILELKEYYERSDDAELVEKAREKIYSLLEFSKKYENGDGLLTDMDSWVFVEWSEANNFVKDINYPSNMLYALSLEYAGILYSDEKLKEKAEKLRKTVIEKAFDGKFFCDNAVYDKNGEAIRTKNRSETCQYYAFFTKTATKESFPELYKTMLEDFGPQRKNNGKYPDIPFSNAFVGVYMRLEMLFRDKQYDRLFEEIKAFFLPMAEKTGTLWENMTDHASCCHGFASHVAYWLNIYGKTPMF